MRASHIRTRRRSEATHPPQCLRHVGVIAAVIALSAAVSLPITPIAAAQQPAPVSPADPSLPQRVAAIKGALAQSQAKLKGYEWIETTTIFLKGDEKSRTVMRCYYGEEGKVQKVTVEAPPEDKPGRGIRGRIKENKKEEMTDYMKSAVELVKHYTPPQQQLVQAALDAGNASLHIVEPAKRVDVALSNYYKPQDSLSIMLDIQANRLLGLEVKTYLDDSVSPGKDPKDPVVMKVKESAFPDGTIYTESVELEAPSKDLKVVVEHSGYRPLAAAPASRSDDRVATTTGDAPSTQVRSSSQGGS